MKKRMRKSQLTLAVGVACCQALLVFGPGNAFAAGSGGAFPTATLSTSKSPQSQKVMPLLDEIYQEYQTYLASGAPTRGVEFASKVPMAQVQDGFVVIHAAAEDAEALRGELVDLGLQNAAVYGHTLSGRFPISNIPQLEAVTSLRLVRPALMQTRAGAVTSQGDLAQYSDVARTNNGIDGSGITVGVISDSYDNLSGAAADVGTGDLPAGVAVLSDLASGGSDEGRAMAQIVYDVAPGSALAFHTAFNGSADFALGIEELAGCPPGSSAGCTPMPGVAADVIVDDIGYADQPFFQDGSVAQAADFVAASGVPYFSSAGNSARNSYESPFRLAAGTYFGVYGFTRL